MPRQSPKSDAEAIALCEGAEDDFVAVGEEGAGFAGGEFDGLAGGAFWCRGRGPAR